MDPLQVECPTCNARPLKKCKAVIFGSRSLDGSFVHIARRNLAQWCEDQMVEMLLEELEEWHNG